MAVTIVCLPIFGVMRIMLFVTVIVVHRTMPIVLIMLFVAVIIVMLLLCLSLLVFFFLFLCFFFFCTFLPPKSVVMSLDSFVHCRLSISIILLIGTISRCLNIR